MSFVNEIAFKELVNDLRVDENLIVEGTANVSNLNVENITVTGQISGLQPHTTFQVEQGEGETEVLELTEKIALMDGQIVANATQAGTNASSLVNKANKLNPVITYNGSDPNYITFQNATNASETTTLKSLLSDKVDTETLETYATKTKVTTDIATAKTSIETAVAETYETKTNVEAKFNHPVFSVEENYLIGQEIQPLEDITLSITQKLAVNGEEITNPPFTKNLRTVLDDRYALKTNVATDIQTAVQTRVNRTNAEVEGETLEEALKIILIPDPLQPAARSETNLKTLLDAKPSSEEVYTKTEIDDLLDDKQDSGSYATTADLATKQDSGSYATTQQLSDGLALKQDTGDYVTSQQLSDGLALKQDTGNYVLTTTLANYATSESVNTLSTSIQGLASTTYVDDNFVKTNDLPDTSGFLTSSDLPDTSGFLTSSDLPDTSGFLTSSDLPDTSGFLTSSDLPNISGKVDKPDDWATAVSGNTNPSLSDYIGAIAPTTDISSKVDKPDDWTTAVSGNDNPSLSDYIGVKASKRLKYAIHINQLDSTDSTEGYYWVQWMRTTNVIKIYNQVGQIPYEDIHWLQFGYDDNTRSTHIYIETEVPLSMLFCDFDKLHSFITDRPNPNTMKIELYVTNYDSIQEDLVTNYFSFDYSGLTYRKVYEYSSDFINACANTRENDGDDIDQLYLPIDYTDQLQMLFQKQSVTTLVEQPSDWTPADNLQSYVSNKLSTLVTQPSDWTPADNLQSYVSNKLSTLVEQPDDWTTSDTLESYVDSKISESLAVGGTSVAVPRIYPPSPFPFDYTANETFRTWSKTDEAYGNGTYTLKLSSVLQWGYADHDVSSVMDEGWMAVQPSGSVSGLHIPSGTQNWIEFKLPGAIQLKMYKITTRDYNDTPTDGYVGAAPRDFDMEGRNAWTGDSSWTKIDVRRDVKFYQNETQSFHINDNAYLGMPTKSFNEFRLFIHRNQNTSAWLIMRELSFWGVEPGLDDI